MSKHSQVQCINGPPPKTWDDYRKGCFWTFRGGHEEHEAQAAFIHGMDTVFNLLEAEFPPAELCQAGPDLLAACGETDRLLYQVAEWMADHGGMSTQLRIRVVTHKAAIGAAIAKAKQPTAEITNEP